MQKKSVLIPSGILLCFLLVSLVSAYSYYGGDNILSNFLNSLDSSTIILGSVFIISFALLHFALSRAFKGENKATAGVLSFVIALLITWGINKSGLDFEGFFYGLGISGEFLITFVSLLIIAGIIFLTMKFGFRWALVIIGSLLVIVSFTELVYQSGIFLILGIIFLIIGFILVKIKKDKSKGAFLRRRWYRV